jgi:hypothetical protein
MIDAEGWKHGERNGLDTRVVHAVNDLHFVFSILLGKKQIAVCVTPCKYSPKAESKKIRPS